MLHWWTLENQFNYYLFFFSFRLPRSEASDYYDGTRYRMAFIKDPGSRKRRFFKFHTKSRETNTLLFFIGTKVSIFLNSS